MFIPKTKKIVFEQSLFLLTLIFLLKAVVATEIYILISRVEPNCLFIPTSAA